MWTPIAEVGVFGDIPGVPAADLAQDVGAEVVTGAAEREGQAETRHGRQGDFEQAGVLGGELAFEKAVAAGR